MLDKSLHRSMRGSWTPKVCKIMAIMAVIVGFGPSFYIFSGFRLRCRVYSLRVQGLGFRAKRVKGLGFLFWVSENWRSLFRQ